jgi:hypothetical protein
MDSIFLKIDDDIDAYRQCEWPAMLPFNGHTCYLVDSVPPAGHCSYGDDVDLFKEGVRNTLLKNVIVRFDLSVYPVNTDGSAGWNTNNSGGQKLITALCIVPQKCGGCGLVCNGSSKGPKNQKMINCSKFRLYDSLKNARAAAKEGKPEPLGPVRLNTYHCDGNNTRGNLGKSMKKRTVTSLPMPGEVTCKVRMILEHDHQTFFLRGGVGHGIHVNHTRMDADGMNMRSRFIDETMINYQKELAIANIEAGKTAAALDTRFGIRLTRRQVACHQSFARLAS